MGAAPGAASVALRQKQSLKDGLHHIAEGVLRHPVHKRQGADFARQLAEAHGGSLRIVASGPQGSTFCLTMPAAPTRCSSN